MTVDSEALMPPSQSPQEVRILRWLESPLDDVCEPENSKISERIAFVDDMLAEARKQILTRIKAGHVVLGFAFWQELPDGRMA